MASFQVSLSPEALHSTLGHSVTRAERQVAPSVPLLKALTGSPSGPRCRVLGFGGAAPFPAHTGAFS